jgi:hypothetical protein
MSIYRKNPDPAVAKSELLDMGGPLPRRSLDLLSPKEAAAYIHKSTSSLAKLRVYGGGPGYFKLGRRVFYDVSDLDEWVYQRRLRSTSDRAP